MVCSYFEFENQYCILFSWLSRPYGSGFLYLSISLTAFLVVPRDATACSYFDISLSWFSMVSQWCFLCNFLWKVGEKQWINMSDTWNSGVKSVYMINRPSAAGFHQTCKWKYVVFLIGYVLSWMCHGLFDRLARNNVYYLI